MQSDWKKDHINSWIRKGGNERIDIIFVENGYVFVHYNYLSNKRKISDKTHLSIKEAIKEAKKYMRTH